jgi:ATP-binding cassette, subfamily F, member 3
VTRSPKLACGYFAQHQIEEMRPQESAYDHLAALMPDAPPESVRARLGGFGFSQDKAFVAVADLSGGERARLNLALVTHDAPGLLVLDEPTNHLDIETREALVQAINDFAGAVVLITHDWHLLELVVDRLWLVAESTVRPFDGDLEDYRRLVLERAGPADGGRLQAANERRAARRRAAEKRRELDPLRQRARQAEQMIARLSREREELDRSFAAVNGSPVAGITLTDTLKRRAEITRLIAQTEAEWLATEEAIERESGR